MGWLWSSTPSLTTPPTSPPPNNDNPPHTLTEPSDPPPPSIPEHSPSPPNPVAYHEPSPDELAEEELRAFINPSSEPSSSPSPTKYRSKYTFQPSPPASPSPSTISSSAPITPSILYPSTISCREAFDSAFYCQSLGGQFNNVYRYGTMKDCSGHWSAFWFCMRTNRSGMSEEQRMNRVQEHYWRREEKYRRGGSSEDVWVARERMVDEGSGEGKFEGDLEAAEKAEREEAERWGGGEKVDGAVGREVGNERRGAMKSLYGG